MLSNRNSLFMDRNLSKNKKYYNQKVKQKDKQNIYSGDMYTIVEKLSICENKSSRVTRPRNKSEGKSSNAKLKSGKEKSELGMNSINFFGKNRIDIVQKKHLKRDLSYYINKIRHVSKQKSSLYQEFLQLSQETSDYLEYYLTNFSGESQGKAAQLLKQQGKVIILLIFRKNFKCFENNSPDIKNRIFLAFHLNPLNDLQFIPWEKYMKMRKLISGEFNNRDYCEFIENYFFLNQDKVIKGTQFWIIFKSVLRKLSSVMDGHSLEVLISRVLCEGIKLIPEESSFGKEELRKILKDSPMFIWHEFSILVFA